MKSVLSIVHTSITTTSTQETFMLKILNKSDEDASEFLENRQEMFPRYYIHA